MIILKVILKLVKKNIDFFFCIHLKIVKNLIKKVFSNLILTPKAFSSGVSAERR